MDWSGPLFKKQNARVGICTDTWMTGGIGGRMRRHIRPCRHAQEVASSEDETDEEDKDSKV